ncbi:MAG: hypothetical protein WAN03_00225 [Candidatus Sulfotelmatobacter sp.]
MQISMDLDRNQRGPAEEEWIAKYRAAVASTAMPQSRTARLRTVFREMSKFVAAVLHKLMAGTKPEISAKERLSAALTAAQPIPVPVRRQTSPIATEPNHSEKAG